MKFLIVAVTVALLIIIASIGLRDRKTVAPPSSPPPTWSQQDTVPA